MRRPALLCVCLVCLVGCLAGPVANASAQTVTDERAWFVLTLQERGTPASPWRWTVEAIVRSREGVQKVDTCSVRPTIIYQITTHSSVGAGYSFAPSFPASGGTTIEHRLYGQYVWAGRAAGGSLNLRTRWDQRFIEGNSGPIARLRQQVKFSHAVRSGGRLALVGMDEVFVNLNATSRSPRGVEQNRAFGGISDALTPSMRVEIGYVNQFLPGHGKVTKMNHVLSGALNVSF